MSLLLLMISLLLTPLIFSTEWIVLPPVVATLLQLYLTVLEHEGFQPPATVTDPPRELSTLPVRRS